MATSVQRLITMVIVLDILLGAVIVFANSNDPDEQIIQQEAKANSLINWSYNLETGFPNSPPDNQNQYLEESYGNLKHGGSSMFSLLKKGVGYQSYDDCWGEDCSIDYMRYAAMGVTLFLVIVNVLAGVEIFFIFYSKKVS